MIRESSLLVHLSLILQIVNNSCSINAQVNLFLDMASDSSGNPYDVTIMRSTVQFGINYSKLKSLPAGKCILSPIFTAGGYDWALEFYPRGITPKNQLSHVSLFLCLESEAKEICVEYTFQALDKIRKFITIGNPKVVNFTKFTSQGEEMARDTIERLYCVNGVLIISCSIRVFDVKSPPLTEPGMVQTYTGGLCEHIEKLWKKGERFDVTFEVEGESISAHRFILVARSPVFETQLFGPMTEAKMEHIKIDEMKAEVFKVLLHFIYTDQLAKCGSSDHETLSVELLQGLLVAALRYSLDKLTLLCEEQLEMNLSVDTVVTTLHLADQHNRAGLKKKCLDFASCPENFPLVALTKGYMNIMSGAPFLFAELSEMVKCTSHFAKKQRTD
jgi:speckle-type POZ protein